MKNYYEILEIDYSASFKEIRSSYRRLSKKYHPDLNPDDKDNEEYYKDIQEAYHHLKDGIKREEFDAQLRALGLGRNKFGVFSKNIRDKFSTTRNPYDLEDDEDEEGHAFRPVFAPPRKRRYRGVLLIAFSIVVIGGIFFIESRIDNLSYSSQIADYSVEIPNSEEEPSIHEKDDRAASTDKQEPRILAVAPELPSSKEDKELRPEDREYSYAVSETPRPRGETVPVTIFSVNHIADNKVDESLTKEASLTVAEEPKVSTPPAPAGESASENRVVAAGAGESKSNASGTMVEANRVFTRVDKKPTFSGGASAFVQYLNSNIQYPPSARASGINGRVLVTFVVEKNGKISNISVIQGIGGGCDEEAVRVMQNAPSWIPGELNGERVRVQCTIPITFKLQ